MVLAAGLGTRLRPLTDERPKPAVPVANRPLVALTLEHVARCGGRFVAINAHHLPDVLEEAVVRHAPADVRTRIFREAQLLGTGGGIRNAARALLEGDPELIVVLNADILFMPDLAGAIATHRRLGAVATMVLRPDPDAARYGAVEIDREGRVRRLLGVPAVGDPLRPMMFTGVHVLARAAFADLPAEGCIVRHSYRRWVDSGAVVAGHVDDTPWRDLGTPAAYLEANLDLASGRARWPSIAPDPEGNLVHPEARVEPGASLREAVVGAGATVRAAARVRRAVVWDGAEVGGEVADAVVTPRTTLRLAG